MTYRGYSIANEPMVAAWVARKEGIALIVEADEATLRSRIDEAVDPWVDPNRTQANGGGA